MLRGGMRGWEEEGMEMEHDIRKKILMAKTGERREYDTSPPPLFSSVPQGWLSTGRQTDS